MNSMESPRFLADHMVIKLGVYLRILGFDAVSDPRLRTHELILRANAEGRVFLTRNRHLPHQYPRPSQALLIRSTDPVVQLKEVVAAFGLNPRAGLFSRCIRCNVPLDKVPDRAEVRDRVHPNVWTRYETFYRCPHCGTVFWKGSHVRNTCRKLGLPMGDGGPRQVGDDPGARGNADRHA